MIVQRYDYTPLQRESVDGKRHYCLPDGSKVPTVATILDRTKPQEKREALANWKKRVGEVKAQEITTEAANRGTRMHDHLEMYANTAVDSEKWKSLSLSDRQGQLKEILRLAKKDAKEFLKESYDPTDKKVGVIMQISDRGISKKDMNNVLDLFGLERDSLWKLDLPQLELLDYYLSNANERKKILSEEIGIR